MGVRAHAGGRVIARSGESLLGPQIVLEQAFVVALPTLMGVSAQPARPTSHCGRDVVLLKIFRITGEIRHA